MTKPAAAGIGALARRTSRVLGGEPAIRRRGGGTGALEQRAGDAAERGGQPEHGGRGLQQPPAAVGRLAGHCGHGGHCLLAGECYYYVYE